MIIQGKRPLDILTIQTDVQIHFKSTEHLILHCSSHRGNDRVEKVWQSKWAEQHIKTQSWFILLVRTPRFTNNSNQVGMSKSDIEHRADIWQLLQVGIDQISYFQIWPLFFFPFNKVNTVHKLSWTSYLMFSRMWQTKLMENWLVKWLTFLHKFKTVRLSGCAQHSFWCQGTA